MKINLTEKNIDAILSLDEARVSKQKKLYERYTGKSIPINSREYEVSGMIQTNKINNHIANDFVTEIAVVKNGYVLGNPIKFELNGDYQETLYNTAVSNIKRFIKINAFDNVISDVSTMATVTGNGVLRLYIDKDANIRCESLPSFNTYFYDNYVMYKYNQNEFDGEKLVEYDVLDVYDDMNIYRYKRKIVKDKKPGAWSLTEEKQHLFDSVPIIKFNNNDINRSDIEPVLSLIDAYDRIMSDMDNEIESFRLAYLIFTGFIPDEEDLKRLYSTGAMYMPSVTCDAKYLTKDINKDAVEWFLKVCRQNIYKFSQTPDMSEEMFAGNTTGVALEMRFRSFEFKIGDYVRELSDGLTRMMQLITSYWSFKSKLTIDYADFNFIFERNLPKNKLEEATITQMLKGNVSELTRLSELSCVADPEQELADMEEDSGGIKKLAETYLKLSNERKAQEQVVETVV